VNGEWCVHDITMMDTQGSSFALEQSPDVDGFVNSAALHSIESAPGFF
jgi:hypothetical protein